MKIKVEGSSNENLQRIVPGAVSYLIILVMPPFNNE